MTRPYLRLVQQLCDGADPDPVYTPLVVRGVERPLTVYRPSECHDSYLVVYAPGGPGRWYDDPSRCEFMVPGTYEGD